ncbi:MAG: lipopolysaccharide heptosyltransferase II [Candidatus Eisenbacteria bacterium]|nr:lipopolysaccharide heptosyltransferase II [Candidatus Eisenbacteria bacterium]
MNQRVPLKTLVIRLSSLGDVVLASAVPRSLKALAPGTHVTFVTKPEYTPVLLNNPSVDEVLTTGGRGHAVLATLRLGRELKARRFDLVVDLQSNLRSVLLSRLASPRKLVRGRKDSLSRHGMVRFKSLRPTVPRHVVQRYLAGLQRLFGPMLALRPRIYLTEREREAGFRLVHEPRAPEAGTPADSRPVVGVCPGARWKTKMWGEDRVVSLAHRLVERGFRVAVLGGPSDEPTIGSLRSLIRVGARLGVMLEGGKRAIEDGPQKPGGVAVLRGAVEPEHGMRFISGDLRTVASAMAHCACVVSNDSGLAHVAHSVDTPVVAIFGPTTPEFGFFPPEGRSVVFSNEFDCKPCDVHGSEECRNGRLICMESVRVEEVGDAVEAVVAGRTRPNPGRVSDTLESPHFRVKQTASERSKREWTVPETGVVAVRVPNWVGDAVMAVPTLTALSRLVTPGRLVLVAHKRVAGLFRKGDLANEILVMSSSRWPSLVAAAIRLRRRGCSLGVAMPDSFASALQLRLAGVPRRVGFGSEMRGALLTTRLAKPRWLHLCEQYSHLLPPDAEYDGRVRMPVVEADVERVRRLLELRGVREGSSLVLLAPGATYGETKAWPPAAYMRLGELLGRSEQAQVVLVGTASERDLCESIGRQSRVSVLNLAGETSLGELAALSAMAGIFVGNDSGAAHVAAAVGCPVVVVVGSTDPSWTAPRGDAVAVVQKRVSCSPCFMDRCPYHLECLTGIDAESVHEVALKLRRRLTFGLRPGPD